MTADRTVNATFTDTGPPAAPALTGTTPDSPDNDNTPLVDGSAQGGSTVRVYTNASCAGAPDGTGTATGGSFSIPVVVADDTSTTFYATASDAGGTSACSSGITYVEDSTASAAPVLTMTTPTSPANDNQPHIHGTAEPHADVFLFTVSDCSGLPGWADHANPATGGAFSIQVSVPDDSTTTFYANAVDHAGNTSACSNGITYVEDTP